MKKKQTKSISNAIKRLRPAVAAVWPPAQHQLDQLTTDACSSELRWGSRLHLRLRASNTKLHYPVPILLTSCLWQTIAVKSENTEEHLQGSRGYNIRLYRTCADELGKRRSRCVRGIVRRSQAACRRREVWKPMWNWVLQAAYWPRPWLRSSCTHLPSRTSATFPSLLKRLKKTTRIWTCWRVVDIPYSRLHDEVIVWSWPS